MSPLPRVLFLALSVVGSVTAAQSPPPTRDGSSLFIELPAEPMGEAPDVSISPDLSTNFNFDAELQRLPTGASRVELERHEAFKFVDAGLTTLRLLPSDTLKPGDRLRLQVHFQDGAAPASARFTLVVSADRAERVVEVYRNARPVASYQQETRAAHAATAKCMDALERVRTEHAGPGGLLGLLASRHVTDTGVRPRDLTNVITFAPGSVLTVRKVASFRSAVEVGLELSVSLPDDARPWKAEGATLTGKRGRELKALTVWQPGPVTGGAKGEQRLVVGTEVTEAELQGTYVLKLWEEGTGRTLVVHDVTFP